MTERDVNLPTDIVDPEYEAYVRACEERKAENEGYLREFDKWLVDAGLSDKTIRRHLDNVDFFLNSYLLYEDAYSMETGCSRMDDFLGYFFIRKCMWSTPAAIKQNAASFKKFYKCMLEKGHISQASYDILLEDIKEGMPFWLADCEAYNNLGNDTYDDLQGFGPDRNDLFKAAYEAVIQKLGINEPLGIEPPAYEEEGEEELPSREAIVRELTLALFYLTSWQENDVMDGKVRRAWKSADWDALDWLREQGLINCTNKAKSVYLTEDGEQIAELTLMALGLEHLIDDAEVEDKDKSHNNPGGWKIVD